MLTARVLSGQSAAVDKVNGFHNGRNNAPDVVGNASRITLSKFSMPLAMEVILVMAQTCRSTTWQLKLLHKLLLRFAQTLGQSLGASMVARPIGHCRCKNGYDGTRTLDL